MLKAIILISFFLNSFLASTLALAAPIDRLGEIAQLPLIRVGVTGAPGNGHQSAGATVVTRLRQLGYQGKIEVVYGDYDWNGSDDRELKHQLGFLFPPFDENGSDDQEFPDRNIRFVSFNYLHKIDSSNFSETELTIMGADDVALAPKDYRTQFLLRLQPLQWSASKLLVSLGKGYESFPLPASKKLGYIFDLADPQNIDEFFAQQMSHQAQLKEKIDGLKKIYGAKDHFDIASAYGHNLKNGGAFTYAQALHQAFMSEPHFFSKGVIIPVFNNLSEGAAKYFHEFDNNPQYEGIIKTAQVTDPNLDLQIRDLAAGQVLIVQVGTVSKDVFEFFYKISSLPPIVEGQNSINLMMNLGKPFLPSSAMEGYPFEVSFLSTAWLKALRAWKAFSIRAQLSTQRIQDIADFLIESKTPNSQMNEIFAAHSPGNNLDKDKLYQGLITTNKAMALRSKSDQIFDFIRGFLKKPEAALSCEEVY